MKIRSWIVGLYFVNGAFAGAYIATIFAMIPWAFVADQFNMDDEATLCSWYSANLLLLSALCWFLQLEFLRKPVERYTAALAALTLTVLSIDESVAVHESVSRKLQVTTHSPFEHTGPAFLIAVPVLILGIAVWRFWPWPGRPAAFLFGGAALLIASACGLEVMANFLTFNSPLYKVEVLFEETGEMTGMTTMLLGSYDHLLERLSERSARTTDLSLENV